MSGLVWFLILLNAYLLLIFLLVRTGAMKRWGLSLFGPALMIKTQRGRGLLDWFAKARGLFDKAAGFGIWLTAFVMAFMSLLLVLQLYFIFQLTPSQAPSPRLILGIPGINPIIPVGFGIVALIFAVVVHEFSHGILARVHGLKVKTMGLLLLVIPIGAFVEPDEDELKAASRSKRVRVYAAGPVSNLFFALLFALIFSGGLMAAAHPVPGVPIQTVIGGGPADVGGLHPGDIINSVNGTPVHTGAEYAEAIRNATLNSTLTLGTYPDGAQHTVVTSRCIDLYSEDDCRRSFVAPTDPNATNPGPFNRTAIGISVYPTDLVHSWLKNPLQEPRALLLYISLPFEAIQGNFPLAGIYQHFYTTPFDPATFWFLANLAYWLFWIDLMLGLTNALPIVPLDGGFIFKDFVGSFVEGWNPHRTPERNAQTVRRVSGVVAIVLLSLILMQFIGPQLHALWS